MKTLFLFLHLSMILFLAHTTATACSLSPTAKIAFPDDQSVHYAGDNIVFDGTTSTANCGSIDQYRWRLNGSTISWSSAFTHNFSLGDGQSEQVHSIELRVRNTAGKYNTKTIQITVTRNNKSLYYLTDHLGSVRVTVNEQGDPVGWDDYYPFGLQMPGRTQNASNPNDDTKFTGYELEQQGDLGIYHAGARMYDPVIGRFTSQDRFKEKYPSMSPYQYAALNPILFIDVNGDSIDVSQLDQETLDWLTGQLQTITGLTLSVNDNGMLVFDPNARVNTDGTSETARNDLSHAIGHETIVTVGSHSGSRGSNHKNGHISLNTDDIRFNEENSVGVSPLTKGMGMTFLHELNHTPIVPSGGTKDDGGDWQPGTTVTHMNKIRDEINNQGSHNMGTRLWYGPFKEDRRGLFIPFIDQKDYPMRVYSRPRSGK